MVWFERSLGGFRHTRQNRDGLAAHKHTKLQLDPTVTPVIAIMSKLARSVCRKRHLEKDSQTLGYLLMAIRNSMKRVREVSVVEKRPSVFAHQALFWAFFGVCVCECVDSQNMPFCLGVAPHIRLSFSPSLCLSVYVLAFDLRR